MLRFRVQFLLLIPFCTALAAGSASPAWAQEGTDPSARAATLGRAWGAIAEQKFDAADQLVQQLLERSPGDHAALLVRITARAAAGKNPAALDAYEQWLQRSRIEDVFLLEPIAAGVLGVLASSPDPAIASASLARLARYDPDRARMLLSSGRAASPAVDAVASALGDPEASARLAQALASPNPRERMLALREVTRPGAAPADPALLIPLLSDPAPPVRADAARALAAGGGSVAADAVRPLLQDPDPYVRASAAVALGKMEDEAGMQALERMILSPVSDIALMAAGVLKERGVDVSAVAERALHDDNPLTRLSAIPLIQAADPARSADLLAQAARDPNPVIRVRAAELLQQTASEDVALLRTLLRDQSDEVRVQAAASLLRIARGV